jgi:putative RNA 2'-phosphotransferase
MIVWDPGGVDPGLVRLSKRLAWALRHDPAGAGLTLDAEGWAAVPEVLERLGLTRARLDAIVEGNDKRRFAVRTGTDGVPRIRAVQGHSVTVELGLSPVDPPAVLFHGTPEANLPSILATGLERRRRQQVHLSADERTAYAVGRRRRTRPVVLRVDAAGMAAAGHLFYRSENGVWLTDHVPPAFLTPPAGTPPGQR